MVLVDLGHSYDATIQEMICAAMQGLSKKWPMEGGISKKKILKVLFNARAQMSADNPVRQKLAYYWYRDGPFSEIVYANIDRLSESGIITKSTNYETYTLVARHAMAPLKAADPAEHVDAAKAEIRRATDAFLSIGAAVEEIYEHAPYAWYRTYKSEFMAKFESYCKSILEERDSRYTNEDIEDLLDEAILAYPTLPEFVDHKMIFMDFSKILNAFLHSDDADHGIRMEMLRVLLNLSKEIWNGFGEIARIGYHDEYYNDKVGKWISDYKDHMSALDSDVIRYTRKFESVTDTRKLHPDIEDVILHPDRHDCKPVVTVEMAAQHE